MKRIARWLATAIVILAGAGCSDLGDPKPVAPSDNGETPITPGLWLVEMRDNFFSPDSLTIAPGDTVKWVNMGFVIHTTTSGNTCGPTGDGKWNSGNMNPGDSFTYVFPDPGENPYYCIPHCLLLMNGHISVEQ